MQRQGGRKQSRGQQPPELLLTCSKTGSSMTCCQEVQQSYKAHESACSLGVRSMKRGQHTSRMLEALGQGIATLWLRIVEEPRICTASTQQWHCPLRSHLSSGNKEQNWDRRSKALSTSCWWVWSWNTECLKLLLTAL